MLQQGRVSISKQHRTTVPTSTRLAENSRGLFQHQLDSLKPLVDCPNNQLDSLKTLVDCFQHQLDIHSLRPLGVVK